MMTQLRERFELLGRSLAILGAYALAVGTLSVVTNISDIADGNVVAICQAVLGIVGIGAGLLVWTLRRVGADGWQVVMIWSVAQLPFIAWSIDGNPTTQMWDLLLGFSASTTVNGVVTSSEAYGINGVGIILCIWATRSRGRWDRVLKPVVADRASVTSGSA